MQYIIGYDVGGTKCAVSLGKVEDGRIVLLGRKETPTTKNPDETLSALEEKTREFLSLQDISDSLKDRRTRPKVLYEVFWV